MPKPASVKTKKAKADRLFSARVRARGECERCGKKPPEVMLQTSHIISRTYLRVRWSFDNALCLCMGCHHWWHNYPVEAENWCREIIGDDVYDDLRLRAVERGQKVDYDEILTYLQTV